VRPSEHPRFAQRPAKSLLSLHEHDPRSHDSAPDLLARAAAAEAETEVEAEVELVTREDGERCPTSPSHVRALRLILRQVEVAYWTVDVAVKRLRAQLTQPRFSHGLSLSHVVVVVASGFHLADRLHFSTTRYT
jgi:hypothetical protein